MCQIFIVCNLAISKAILGTLYKTHSFWYTKGYFVIKIYTLATRPLHNLPKIIRNEDFVLKLCLNYAKWGIICRSMWCMLVHTIWDLITHGAV